MESIPGLAAWFYWKLAARSPWMEDFYREVVEEVGGRMDSGRVLDIGTGPGLVPIKLAGKCGGLEVHGIDLSHAMVEIASKNARQAGLSGRAIFQYGSAGKIPFDNGHFDLAITTLSFHHWEKQEEDLREVSRVLKDNGELWIYEIKHEPTQANREEVRRKYGPFLSFVVLNFIRNHSSISFNRVMQVQSCKDIGFSQVTVDDEGLFVKMRLSKREPNQS